MIPHSCMVLSEIRQYETKTGREEWCNQRRADETCAVVAWRLALGLFCDDVGSAKLQLSSDHSFRSFITPSLPANTDCNTSAIAAPVSTHKSLVSMLS